MCVERAGGSRGKPKRPSSRAKTNSGSGTCVRPVSRISIESGTGCGPATLKTPRRRFVERERDAR